MKLETRLPDTNVRIKARKMDFVMMATQKSGNKGNIKSFVSWFHLSFESLQWFAGCLLASLRAWYLSDCCDQQLDQGDCDCGA